MIKAVMYHYVKEYNEALPHFSFLHINDFRRQLDYFTEHFGIIHPGELQNVATGKQLPGVVLTFDDGVKDHYHYVFPELKKRGLAGIFYISTGVFDSGRLLGVHRLHLLLGKLGGCKVHKQLMQLLTPAMLDEQHIQFFEQRTYRYQSNDEKTQQVKRLLNFYVKYEFRQQLLDTLMTAAFENEEELAANYYLSQNEIRQMHNEGMVFGSHTVTHPVLSKLDKQQQKVEIETSIHSLEAITGGLQHRTFCHPYGGAHSFTTDTVAILQQNGIVYSFSVEPREVLADDLINRPHALPRFDCNMFPHGKIYELAS